MTAKTKDGILILLILLMCFAGFKAIDYLERIITPPVALNSLPATKIKCRPGAIDGWCAKGYTVRQYEAMQK